MTTSYIDALLDGSDGVVANTGTMTFHTAMEAILNTRDVYNGFINLIEAELNTSDSFSAIQQTFLDVILNASESEVMPTVSRVIEALLNTEDTYSLSGAILSINPGSLNFNTLPETIGSILIEALLNTNDTVATSGPILSISPGSLNFGSLPETIGLIFIEALLNTQEFIGTPVLSITPGTLNFGSLTTTTNSTTSFMEAELNTLETDTFAGVLSFFDSASPSDQSAANGPALTVNPGTLNFGSLASASAVSFMEAELNTAESTTSSGINAYNDFVVPTDSEMASPTSLTYSPSSLNFGSLPTQPGTANISDTTTSLGDAITSFLSSSAFSEVEPFTAEGIFQITAFVPLVETDASLNDGTIYTTVQPIPDSLSTLSDGIRFSGVVAFSIETTFLSDQLNQASAPTALNEITGVLPGDSAIVSSFQVLLDTTQSSNENVISTGGNTFVDILIPTDLSYLLGPVLNIAEPTTVTLSDSSTISSMVLVTDTSTENDAFTFSFIGNSTDSIISLSDNIATALPSQSIDEVLGLLPTDVGSQFGLIFTTETITSSNEILVSNTTFSYPVSSEVLISDDVQDMSLGNPVDSITNTAEVVAFIPPITSSIESANQSTEVLTSLSTFSFMEDALLPTDSIATFSSTLAEIANASSESFISIGQYAPVEQAINLEIEFAKATANTTIITNYAVAYFTFRGGYGYSKTLSKGIENFSTWYVGQTEPVLLAVLRSDNGRPINLQKATSISLLIHSSQGDRVGTGAFSVINAMQGLVVYEWGEDDVNQAGKFSLQINIQDLYGIDKSDLIAWNISPV